MMGLRKDTAANQETTIRNGQWPGTSVPVERTSGSWSSKSIIGRILRTPSVLENNETHLELQTLMPSSHAFIS
jgi:hypothetical protein